MDSSTERLTVFSDIVRKNIVIRSVFFFYDMAPEFIKAYLLILYGLKCYLSANWRGTPAPDIVYFASCPNEHVAIAHVRSHLRGQKAADIALSRGNCFRPEAFRALPEFFYHALRLRRLARRLVRQFHFLPACRIFSTMTYYLRFRRLLGAGEAKAVFLANHYSPESLALAAAAHQSGRKVFCTNHANGTWRSGYVPPLHSDLVAVTSEAILDAYARHSARELNSIFIPQPSPKAPMQSRIEPGKPITVGIFLTALTNMKRLRALVGQLESNPLVAEVLIRSHPVKVVNEDLSGVMASGDRLMDSSAFPLSENIGLCDVAICGNSSVTIDILRGGVPVLYDAGLDDLAFDVNGYLNQQLVPPMPTALDAAALQSLDRFYSAPSWAQTMRYFDAGYGQNEGVMFHRLRSEIRMSLRPPVVAAERAEKLEPRKVPGKAPFPVTVS